MIRGITVDLYEKVQTGVDEFNAPLYEEKKVPVKNVLVSPSSTEDITDSTNLFGKVAVYTLGIPKGDTHDWEDKRVDFFGTSWKTFGFVTRGIPENVPTAWNAKVMVERYG